MMSSRRITAALVALVVLALGGWLVQSIVLDGGSTAGSGAPSPPASAPASSLAAPAVPGSSSGLKVVTLSSLPPQAAETWRLIRAGGPYPYPRNDDVVFANREGLLPREPSGYYHEYTVVTPGRADRGARRLITGTAHELYYTDDHYASFVVVDPSR
jgi:ribonuclease T1